MKKALQLYYTSCRKGLSSGSGFQTFSMSEGISNEERLELEHYGLYVAPFDMPSQPSKTEVATMFPTSFSFFRLRTGRFGVAQSKYIGEDYSRRFGNYFAHVLLLDDGRFPFHPIRLMGSSLFREGLTEQEMNTLETPDPLPPLQLDEQALDGPVDKMSVREFVCHHHRGDLIQEIVAAVLDFETSHRPLVLCDEWENIPFWIAAVQMAFPVEMAHGITFNTYTADPETSNTLLSATSRTGSRFDFSEYQSEFQYHIFDFLGDRFSIVEEKARYGRVVWKNYSASDESLTAFHEFIEKFQFREINEEIDAAHDLFELIHLGLKSLDQNHIAGAIKFANDYAPSSLIGELAEKIADIVPVISREVDFRTAHIITEFLFRISSQTKDSAHLDTAYTFFFNCLDHLISYPGEGDFEQLAEFNSKAFMNNRQNSREFVSRWIAPERLKDLRNKMVSSGPPSLASAYFVLTINNLITTQTPWPKAVNNPEFLPFIDTCLERIIMSGEELHRTFSKLSTGDDGLNVDFFAGLMAHAVEAAKGNPRIQEDLVSCFSHKIREKNSDWALSVRKRLMSLGHGDLIFGEFLLLLEQSGDVACWFWEYHKAVFTHIREYQDVYFGEAIGAYVKKLFSTLSPEKRGPECAKLLPYADAIREKLVIEKIVLEFEGILCLEPPSEELLAQIHKANHLKRKFLIRTSPDICGLILFAIRLQDLAEQGGKVSDGFEDDLLPLFQGIDEKTYRTYLRWILPASLALIETPNDHDMLIDALSTESFHLALADNYLRCLDHFLKKSKRKKGVAFQTLWNFMAFYLQTENEKENQEIKAIKNLMKKGIIKLLSSQPKESLNKMAAIVNKEKPGSGLSKKRWQSVYDGVEERSGSLMDSLFRFFRRR